MKKRFYTLFTILLVVIFFAGNSVVKSQTSGSGNTELEKTLSSLSSNFGSAYVAPIASAFGSNLNSGWVSGVPSQTLLGFHIEVKVVGTGSFFSDDSKTFATSGTFNFTSGQVDAILQNETNLQPGSAKYNSVKNEMLNQEWNVSMNGPTIVGSGDNHVQVQFPGTTIQGENIGQYTFDIDEVTGYLDELPLLPSAAAQLTVGTVAGTYASVRYFPEIDIQDLGKFKWIGFGLLHNPGFWLANPLPLDIAVGYFYQKLNVGDIFETKTSQFGLYASKSFGVIISVTPYAGVTIESSTTTVAYDYQFDTPAGPQLSRITFDMEGENSLGFTLGTTFRLAALRLNVDYKLAKVNTISAGVSLGW